MEAYFIWHWNLSLTASTDQCMSMPGRVRGSAPGPFQNLISIRFLDDCAHMKVRELKVMSVRHLCFLSVCYFFPTAPLPLSGPHCSLHRRGFVCTAGCIKAQHVLGKHFSTELCHPVHWAMSLDEWESWRVFKSTGHVSTFIIIDVATWN